MEDFEKRYLSGQELWGDDFDQTAIEGWFTAEQNAYADLGSGEHASAQSYGYSRLNIQHGFRYLPAAPFDKVLGLGSSYGGEFLPILDRIGSLTIVEPSLTLRSKSLGGLPLQYVSPLPTGLMPFFNDTFDLSVSFGTLHHIANVTQVVRELARVTRRGGWILIREPIISMGDWRQHRPGLTRNERGIPLHLLRRMLQVAGLMTVRETLCEFPTTRRLHRIGLGFDSALGVAIDLALSVATKWNLHYHARKSWQKIRPTSAFFVLTK